MNAPAERRTHPLLWIGLALIALAGVLGWQALSRDTISEIGPTPPRGQPTPFGPQETQAAVMVKQLAIQQTAAVPTPRPTLIPPTPMPTVDAWTHFPTCRPGLVPGSLCQPKRPQPPEPTPVATCPAYPSWIEFCAMPGSDADTNAEVPTR